jgi:Ca2+-binding RTX toxin-like protein
VDDAGDGGSGDDYALIDIHTRSSEWRLRVDGDTIEIDPASGSERGVNLKDVETVAVLFGSDADDANGGDEKDQLFGGDGNDDLSGGEGDDALIGGAGDDHLRGGTGVDWFDGVSGRDIATVDLSDETGSLNFLEDQGESDDGFTFANGTHVQNIDVFDLTTGSGTDVFSFGLGDIKIDAGAGDDVFYTVGHKEETIEGGSGLDRVVVDYSWATDHVRTAYVSSTGSLWVYVGQSTQTTDDYVVAHGTEQYEIVGGSNSDFINGRSGDDRLIGGAGDDNLSGSWGHDILTGGLGDDSLSTSDGGDSLDGGDGTDDFSYVDTSGNGVFFDAAAAASEHGLFLRDGTFLRSIERVQITSTNGDDQISLLPQGGNSLFLGLGHDLVAIDYSQSLSAVSSSSGSQAWNIANDAGDSVEISLQIVNSELSLNIIGSTKDDAIRGLIGNDTLAGGLGNDILDGGDGNDTADYGSSSTRVIARLGTGSADGWGHDSLISVENVVGTNFRDHLVGNESDNKLYGSGRADHLLGGDGSDWLDGGAGNNETAGGEGNDYFVLSAGKSDVAVGGEGNDVFYMGGAYTTGDRLDGGRGTDTLYLDGTYKNATLSGVTLKSVEILFLGAGHDYVLTISDEVSADGRFTINARSVFVENAVGVSASNASNTRFLFYDAYGVSDFVGGNLNDTFDLTAGYRHKINAGAGKDLIYFGSNFTSRDRIDGGTDRDTVILNGDYSANVKMKDTTISNVERIFFTDGNDYQLTTADGNLRVQQRLVIDASTLGAPHHLTFNGSSEKDGSFSIIWWLGRRLSPRWRWRGLP